MGNLITRIRINGKSHPLEPLARQLRIDACSLSIDQVCLCEGGLILGEGDTGKTTYAKMLAEAAERQGPVLFVPLRHRKFDFPLPPVADGQVATVILDGLDEFPECARDIVDAYAAADRDRYHVWVTSRACDAAARVCEEPRFERICRLDPFTRKDILSLASAAGLDGEAFAETVDKIGLGHFLEKPGAAVVLLQLFADELLSRKLSAAEIMLLIAERLAAETRDGHECAEGENGFLVFDLVQAAAWISACLKFGRCPSLWKGPECEAAPSDLRYREMLLPCAERDCMGEVVLRRLFEPLTPNRLRLAYSGMRTFLAGYWLSEQPSVSLESLERCSLISVKAVAWASCFKPELGLPFVERVPVCFCRCHRLIVSFGLEKFFDAFVHWYWHGIETHPRGEWTVRYLRGLYGFSELADLLVGILRRTRLSDEQKIVALLLLKYCASDGVVFDPGICHDMANVLEPHVRKYFVLPSSCRKSAPGRRFDDKLPTEREVAKLLSRSDDSKTIELVMRAQVARGLPYHALTSHISERLGRGGPGIFRHRDLLAVAIAQDARIYLPLVVCECGRDEAISFLEFMCREHPETMESAIAVADTEIVRALAEAMSVPSLRGFERIRRAASNRVESENFDRQLRAGKKPLHMLSPKELCAFTAAPKSLIGSILRLASNKVRKVRVDRATNVRILCAYLKEQMSALLSGEMSDEARVKLQRELMEGKYLAEKTGIREGTVGQLVLLCGAHRSSREKVKPDEMAQMFYNICTNTGAFEEFRRYVGTFGKPLFKYSLEELYHRFKSYTIRQTSVLGGKARDGGHLV